MSDLLRTLSRQLLPSQSGAGTIRPRGRSRFEPYGDGRVFFGGGLAFDGAEFPAPLATPATVEPQASSQRINEPKPRAETFITPQVEGREAKATIAPARETIREFIRSVERSPQPESRATESHAAPMSPSTMARAEGYSEQAAPIVPVTTKATATERQETFQPQAIRPQTLPRESRPERISPQRAERASIPVLAPRSVTRVPAEDMGHLRAAASTQPVTQPAPPAHRQEITIEIGSIIVRGDAPERRAPHGAATTPPPQPTLSLERYLQHRGGAN